MSRHPIRLAVALVLLLAGLRWIWNSNEWSGPVLMSVSSSHGVHANDWFTAALWSTAFAVACPMWVQVAARRARALVNDRSR